MTRIWSQVTDAMKANIRAMHEKYNQILQSRAKFTFGTKFPKSNDPEKFIEFRKLQTKQPNRQLIQKMDQLKFETMQNERKAKEEREQRIFDSMKQESTAEAGRASSPKAKESTLNAKLGSNAVRVSI